MRLTKDEKKLLVHLLKKHREDVQFLENIPNQNPVVFSSEVKYDEFLEKLIKKLK